MMVAPWRSPRTSISSSIPFVASKGLTGVWQAVIRASWSVRVQASRQGSQLHAGPVGWPVVGPLQHRSLPLRRGPVSSGRSGRSALSALPIGCPPALVLLYSCRMFQW